MNTTGMERLCEVCNELGRMPEWRAWNVCERFALVTAEQYKQHDAVIFGLICQLNQAWEEIDRYYIEGGAEPSGREPEELSQRPVLMREHSANVRARLCALRLHNVQDKRAPGNTLVSSLAAAEQELKRLSGDLFYMIRDVLEVLPVPVRQRRLENVYAHITAPAVA